MVFCRVEPTNFDANSANTSDFKSFKCKDKY